MKKITKKSLVQMASLLPELSVEDQREILGGTATTSVPSDYTGTVPDPTTLAATVDPYAVTGSMPTVTITTTTTSTTSSVPTGVLESTSADTTVTGSYTWEEMEAMIDAGEWQGGIVDGSYFGGAVTVTPEKEAEVMDSTSEFSMTREEKSFLSEEQWGQVDNALGVGLDLAEIGSESGLVSGINKLWQAINVVDDVMDYQAGRISGQDLTISLGKSAIGLVGGLAGGATIVMCEGLYQAIGKRFIESGQKYCAEFENYLKNGAYIGY